MTKVVAGMRKKLLFVLGVFSILMFLLIIRVGYIQIAESEWLQGLAYEQQTRDRLITPKRGSVLDRNMVGLAETESVCSVSSLYYQLGDREKTAQILSDMLELDYNAVLKKLNHRVALERIKTKVDKETADAIRALKLPGIVVDEDVKRVYPYNSLASHVIGFVGKDNQGIIGLEAKYDKYLKGEQGKIQTETDVKGIEMKNAAQKRLEPKPGYNLVTTLDANIQQFAEQTLAKTVEAKRANRGSIILLNPQNGEIYAMANAPDFDLNNPFEINDEVLKAEWGNIGAEEQNVLLNQMWRNFSLNDTYEPGSSFKIVTSAAGLNEGEVTLESPFNCSGSKLVGGRQIKCWRHPRAHGAETFLQGIENSCNPVFMDIAERLGTEKFYEYLGKFGIMSKTGVDLPGEAVGIMHKLEKIGPVELATISFGQSFQITPLQLLRAASAAVNGGYLITPHVGKEIVDENGGLIETLEFPKSERIISEETSETMKYALQMVVQAGTGNRTYIPGYRIGGKTATSEKLPRSSNKYIASFVAFAPAEEPRVMAIILIDEPQGTYYGGQVTGPVMKELLSNVLPYLGIEPDYSEEELKLPETAVAEVPDCVGMTVADAKKAIKAAGLEAEIQGEGSEIIKQFPVKGEKVNPKSKIILYTGELNGNNSNTG